MNTVMDNSDRDPLDELAEEFVGRFRHGERPALTEYTTRYPELADEIRELFPALVLMEQAGSDAGAVGGRPGSATSDDMRLEQVGEYRILQEVGWGGMGVVYEAEQESLGRRVALKVLPYHALMNPKMLSRFHREARAAANLHHTNIVPVFGVGESKGVHYYAMQFVHGQGLDEVMVELVKLRRAQQGGSQSQGDAPKADALSVTIAQNLVAGASPAEVTDPAGAKPKDCGPEAQDCRVPNGSRPEEDNPPGADGASDYERFHHGSANTHSPQWSNGHRTTKPPKSRVLARGCAHCHARSQRWLSIRSE